MKQNTEIISTFYFILFYLFYFIYLFDSDHRGPYAITHIKYTQEVQ